MATKAITAPPIDTTAPGPNGGVVVRWFVGLGAGGQPQQLQKEAEFVDAYNKSQKDVYIALVNQAEGVSTTGQERPLKRLQDSMNTTT